MARDYGDYTYLGGEEKTSLPKSERASILEDMTGSKVTRLLLSSAPSIAVDALLYLGTGQQPDLPLETVSACPHTLRAQCKVVGGGGGGGMVLPQGFWLQMEVAAGRGWDRRRSAAEWPGGRGGGGAHGRAAKERPKGRAGIDRLTIRAETQG